MTKFFIATIIGCGLMIPTQALAISTAKTSVNKEIGKDAHHKVVKKAVNKKKVAPKKAAKKSEKKAKRTVVSLDFSEKEKKSVDFKKVQIVKAKNIPAKKTVKNKDRKLASVSQPMSVKQLKKTTKPYWAAYCRDGIVLNSQVYCALKNPQKNGLKAKNTKMAVNRDLEAKKRK